MREIRIFKSMYKVIARHIPNLDSFYCALICRVFNLNSPYEGWTSLIGSLEFQQERMVGGNLSVFIFWELPDDTMKNSMSPAKFMGYVSDDSVEGEIFSATDLFLVPSFAYNFSVTIFESMFCVNSMEGIDLCGTPEVVRYGKWYSWQCIMQLMTLPEKFIFSLIKILCVVSLMNSYLVLCNGSILY